jgi:orotate phosphoribosyltransferase-like protein
MKKKATPEIIKRINELKKQGLSAQIIAARLGVSKWLVWRAPKQ